MATMLGIVGAGGIGYELQSFFRMFEYQKSFRTINYNFYYHFYLYIIYLSFIPSKVKVNFLYYFELTFFPKNIRFI
jgi:ABC-type phosphate/phosphonate transport system, permease component